MMPPRRHRGRWAPRPLLLLAAALALLAPVGGRAQEPIQRSVSQSRQFVIYCSDIRLRMAVAGYAETAKHGVLEALGLGDHWKFPIVIDLRQPASTDTGRPISQVGLIQTDGGWKTEIDVLLREGELKQVRFPQLVIRAILLELAYRDRPPQVGAAYSQPPAWLVEALAQAMQTRATGAAPNAALFRQLIATGRPPKIADFLKSNVEVMDPTSLAIHGACAASLLDLLVGTPGGQAGLARMVHGLPDSNGDAMALLLQYFPLLGGNEAALEKWWTLGLARTSALDSHQALTLPETDARLTPLLKITLVTDPQKKTTAEYALTDYKTFLKNPGAKAALLECFKGLSDLMPQAHPLLRPVLLEYQRIIGELARGKAHGADKALEAIAGYRELIVARMDKIDDYLNWYEATQMPEQSGAFNDFLQDAKAMETWTPPKRNDAISKYIDQLQREFE
ncbi:MAG: hypothetical protein WCH57_11055 [Verrucomicrobiota bacterium]